MGLHERINERGWRERVPVLDLAQALFDLGYERPWRHAVRAAEDRHRRMTRRTEAAMGWLPRRGGM